MKRSNSADVLSRWATTSATASYPVAIAARHVQNKSRNLTGPFVVADVITGTSKAMLAPTVVSKAARPSLICILRKGVGAGHTCDPPR